MRSTRLAATASAASWAVCSRACSACRSSRGLVKGGLFYTGDVSLLISQILGIVVTVAIVLVLDLVIAAVVKALFHGSLRVDGPTGAGPGCEVSAARSAYPSFSRTRLAASPSTAPCRSIVAHVLKYASLLFQSAAQETC